MHIPRSAVGTTGFYNAFLTAGTAWAAVSWRAMTLL
jgi:hypothetical protein